MPTSAKGTPYPASTSTPDVPADLLALVTALDGRVPKAIKFGTVTVNVTAAVAGTQVAAFSGAAFGTAPLVFCQAVGTTLWVPFVSGVTVSQFTCTARHIDNTATTASPQFNYMAVEF